MNSLSIESLTLEEFKAIVNDIIVNRLDEYFKGREKDTVYISRKEAANILGCSTNTLYDWTLKGFLKAYKFGRGIRYIKHEVEEAGPTIVRRKKKGDNYDR